MLAIEKEKRVCTWYLLHVLRSCWIFFFFLNMELPDLVNTSGHVFLGNKQQGGNGDPN